MSDQPDETIQTPRSALGAPMSEPQKRWVYDVVQTFRDGRKRTVATRSTKRDAEDAADAITDEHASVHGYAFATVVRRKTITERP